MSATATPTTAATPVLDMGGTATVSLYEYGLPGGVTGTGQVTVSGYTQMTPQDITASSLQPTGSLYKAMVNIADLTGKYNYNVEYFSLRTPQGDIIRADSLGLEPSLGSGELNTGEKRRGNIVFDIPAGSDVSELVLVGTDLDTKLAGWKVTPS